MKLSLTMLGTLFVSLQATNNFCDCGTEGKHWDIDTQKCEELKEGDTGYVANCFQHAKNVDTKAITCAYCEKGYYLKNNQCQQHNLAGCDRAQDRDPNPQCTICDLAYALKVEDFTCVEMTNDDKKSNCLIHIQQGGNFQCHECKESFYVKDHSCHANPTQGNEFVENCKEYEYENSALKCSSCSNKYYYNPKNNKCVSYTDTTSEFYRTNCVDYGIIGSNDHPFCSECEVGYLSKQDSSTQYTECLQNPQSGEDGYDANCAGYFFYSIESKKKCNNCKDGFYRLTNFTCIEIPNHVQNCHIYDYNQADSSFKCTNCRQYFWSIDNYTTCNACPVIQTSNNTNTNTTGKKKENSQGIRLGFQVQLLSVLIALLFVLN